MREGGNFAGLLKDILNQAFPTSAAPRDLIRRSPGPLAQFPAPVSTGPP
jgi:hypothetical protein